MNQFSQKQIKSETFILSLKNLILVNGSIVAMMLVSLIVYRKVDYMLTPIIEVEGLTFQYDKRLESETLSNVSFTIEKGEWVSIVGKNGSGKSTLAQLLVGLLEPKKWTYYVLLEKK